MKYVSLITTNCEGQGRENAISIEHPEFRHIVIFFLISSWRGCVKYIYEGCSEREGTYCILNYERKISLSSGRRNRAHLKFDRSRWKKHFQGKQQQEIIKMLWESDQHKKKLPGELFVKDFPISFIFWFSYSNADLSSRKLFICRREEGWCFFFLCPSHLYQINFHTNKIPFIVLLTFPLSFYCHLRSHSSYLFFFLSFLACLTLQFDFTLLALRDEITEKDSLCGSDYAKFYLFWLLKSL